MKLVINIPCLNEEEMLPVVLAELPRQLQGVNQIVVQVIDDGSTDGTAQIALEHGCHLIQHKRHRGLGRAFNSAVWGALEIGADVMVNIDADNQYPARYIGDLIEPIWTRRADIVIGNRHPEQVPHFSRLKRLMQRLGNWTVQWLVGEYIQDSVSGFRAYSRDALLNLNVLTKFSYTLDTLAQATRKGLKVISVDITPNPPVRPSRLFRNIWEHILRSSLNLLTVFVIYEPFWFFAWLSGVFGFPALLLAIRFMYFYLGGTGDGHVQSLIFAAIGFTLAGLLFVLGVLGHLIGHVRAVVEESLVYQKQRVLEKSNGLEH